MMVFIAESNLCLLCVSLLYFYLQHGNSTKGRLLLILTLVPNVTDRLLDKAPWARGTQ